MIVAQREANVKPTRSQQEANEKHTVMILVKFDKLKKFWKVNKNN